MDKYLVVTTVSTHRVRYAIPVQDLENENLCAEDLIAQGEVEEFSQKWLGEQIVDSKQYDQQEILDLLDDENSYLKQWSIEEKINVINKWKVR